MAKIEVNGWDRIEHMFGKLAAGTKGILKASLYEGAKTLADETAREVQRLKESEPGKPKEGNLKKIYRSVTDLEKKQLEKSLGIMKFEEALGGYRTVIGFAGYGGRKTTKYPKGLPNPLLARSIAKPSNLRRGRKFTKIAVHNVGFKALDAMENKAKKMIDNIVDE